MTRTCDLANHAGIDSFKRMLRHFKNQTILLLKITGVHVLVYLFRLAHRLLCSARTLVLSGVTDHMLENVKAKSLKPEPVPSVAYVTFGWRRFHEFTQRTPDTLLHVTDKQHVGGNVLTDGGRFGSSLQYTSNGLHRSFFFLTVTFICENTSQR